MVLEPSHACKLKVAELYFSIRAFFGSGRTAYDLLVLASKHDYALQVFNQQIKKFSEPLDSDDHLFVAVMLLWKMRRSVEDWEYYALQAKSYRDTYVGILKQMRDRGVFTGHTLPDTALHWLEHGHIVDGCMVARTLAELE